MRLDILLVEKGLCGSRTEAKECILKGFVIVDGKVVTKGSKDVKDGQIVSITASRLYVSRGGEKLEGVFMSCFKTQEKIKEFLAHKKALDVGSSTGGFTDFLLQNSIESVVCVDVGTNQLHKKIKEDIRAKVLENTDIRSFATEEKFDIIVADLSFISLKNVLSSILEQGKTGSHFFLLIKPQFEVGKGNTKKGIVKDEDLVISILETYIQTIKDSGGKDEKVYPCAIKGGDGNQEYFITFSL